jgi:hypothetical protein
MNGVISACAYTGAAQNTFTFFDVGKYGISPNMNGFNGASPDARITRRAFTFI